jgi:tetratricopeptide (TPR) repeat protein
MTTPSAGSVDDIVVELTALLESDEPLEAEDLLEPLRNAYRAQRDGYTLPPWLATLAFKLATNAYLDLPARLAIYRAISEVWRDDADYKGLAEKRIEEIEVRNAREEHSRLHREEIDRFAEMLASATDTAELRTIAKAAREEQQHERYLLVLNRLLELDRSTASLVALGAAFRRDGDFDRAQPLLEEALEREPSTQANRPGYTAMMALKRTRGGVTSLREAKKIGEDLLAGDSEDPYALNALGGVEADLGNLPRAEELLRAASERAPHKTTARTELRRLRRRYVDAGDFTGAARIDQVLADLAAGQKRGNRK